MRSISTYWSPLFQGNAGGYDTVVTRGTRVSNENCSNKIGPSLYLVIGFITLPASATYRVFAQLRLTPCGGVALGGWETHHSLTWSDSAGGP